MSIEEDDQISIAAVGALVSAVTYVTLRIVGLAVPPISTVIIPLLLAIALYLFYRLVVAVELIAAKM